VPDRIYDALSRKARWWMATAFVLGVALILLVLVGVTVDQRGQIVEQQAEIARLDALRRSDAKATRTAENTAAVVSCLSGVYDVPNFLAALDGLDTVLANQVEQAEASLALNPSGPLAESRKKAWLRAVEARKGLARLISGEDGLGGIAAQRKTLPECRSLARELDVEFDPLLRQAADR
jgi:hypothetical protein